MVKTSDGLVPAALVLMTPDQGIDFAIPVFISPNTGNDIYMVGEQLAALLAPKARYQYLEILNG